ncbi:MAG TPA: zinc-ribbon domain-containing protein, partial [Kofleriaceae bacterium]
MDVRCEKCQTEYELDEARLKPGGVTVKCTNCGHTFRVRKRTTTNVGAPAPAQPQKPAAAAAPTVVTRAPPPPSRADSIFEDERTEERLAASALDEAPTTVDRQWLIRLENGEQKSCRELATLQQWIITNVVTRESLISRTGKTWKRLGDVVDLGQYFTIADEARANRERSKPTPRPAPPQASGGTILPDDDEPRTTRAFRGAPTPPPVPPRGAIRTPILGSPMAPAPPPQAAVQATSETVPSTGHVVPRRPATQPPPPPPQAKRSPAPTPPPIPQGGRATAMWATDAVKPEPNASSTAPFIGKLSAVPDGPAFAGKVRIAPGAESSFESGRVMLEDDDDVLPARRGGRTGMIVLVMALLVMGGAAAVVYIFVIRGGADQPVAVAKDAGAEPVARDATAVVTAPADTSPAVPDSSPLDAAHGELRADVEPRLRTAIEGLDGKPDAPAQAMRAYLTAQLAQDLIDRASLLADKPAADGLRKDARQLVLDAASAAQRALKAAGDDAGANLAMAEVLRLQGKPAREAKRYLDTARGNADKDWARELALAEALQQVHDGKLDDAKAGFTAIDQGDGKLEASGDVRARFHLALVLAAQAKPADARPLADSIIAAQPEHAGAKALLARLETHVETSDPLPPEEGSAPT